MNKTLNKMAGGFILLSFMVQVSCTHHEPTDLTATAFIPLPVRVEATGDVFRLTSGVKIYAQGELASSAQFLASELEGIIGTKPVVKLSADPPRRGIYLSDSGADDESYELQIEKKRVSLTGSPAGRFYGIQTFLQTLPAARSEGVVYIPTGVVNDQPYYAYRGAMLDVARHFFPVEDVKKYMDYLAMYKMNVLHLHLSDDQGWRIEIKSWPDLTVIGGSSEVGGGEGGYYTQEEFRDLVQYAVDRHITIVPEIDMPGHTNAALASYAELNCDGKATELYTGTRVGFSTLCIDKEITYQFVDDVVREIAEMTPGPYFHMGGDESHSTPLEDYIPFVERVQDIVVSYNKKVIGWDEIAHSDLAEGAIVQFWANEENTAMGIEKGAKVIMSPAKRAYIDMKYDSTTVLGLAWAAYIEVDDGYTWDPENYSPAIKRENILGVETPLWSETVTNLKEVEYMIFPRLPGYAEIGWTAPDQRIWEEYKFRLAAHGERFEALDITYYRSPLVPWKE